MASAVASWTLAGDAGGTGCSDDEILQLAVLLGTPDSPKLEAAQFICARAQAAADSIDTGFLLNSAFLVFCMQAGFAMLCAGSVRSKNTLNILLKNVLDASVGSVAFWCLGFGFAAGDGNSFIGNSMFATYELLDEGNTWHFFLFQWAFAAAAATIVSGSVAERTSLVAYFGYSIILTGFVYPVVAHWVWHEQGWLSAGNEEPLLDSGMIDFGGSGVVHMVGGFAGLMGAYFVGPRMGRFDADGKANDLHGHSATLVVLGTFILWFGWYGFNPGSSLGISSRDLAQVTGRTAVVTTVAAGSGGIMALFLGYFLRKSWDLIAVCNGLLSGLVAVTCGCAFIEPWAGILCGCLAAFMFEAGSAFLRKIHVDDPLEAAPMHGGCGMMGVVFNGLFAKREYVLQVFGRDKGGPFDKYGLFYGGGGNLLGCQVIGVLCIAVWTCFTLGPFFYACAKIGILRVPAEMELIGLDISKHGGSAYYLDEDTKTTGSNIYQVNPEPNKKPDLQLVNDLAEK